MIEVKKFFGFAFGGNNDFGEEIALKESKLIDFSSKPTGVGFAIRNNQEADLSNQSSMVALVTGPVFWYLEQPSLHFSSPSVVVPSRMPMW